MTIELNLVVLLLGLATTLGSFFLSIYRLMARFEQLEKSTEHQKEDMEIILQTLIACLEGFHQKGDNGLVAEALERVQHYLIENRYQKARK